MRVLARYQGTSEYCRYRLGYLNGTAQHDRNAMARGRQYPDERYWHIAKEDQSVNSADSAILEGTEWHELGKRDVQAQL